jgi:hypothetical protein
MPAAMMQAMHLRPPLGVVIVAQFVLGLIFQPVLRWTGAKRWIGFAGLLLAVMTAPLALEVGYRRAIAMVVAAWVGVKLYDLRASVAPHQRPSLFAYWLFLINPLWMVYHRPPARQPRDRDWRRLVVRLAGCTLAASFYISVMRASIQPQWLALLARGTTLMLLAIAVTNSWAALWRLGGGIAMDPMNRPFLARTPADFWRRWNRPTQQFLRVYFFAPAGGMRRPWRATMLTFFVSALLHEYLFSAAAGRLQGYQSAFFLLHGAASAATIRVRPSGWRAIGWIAGTLVFVLLSSLLFFQSMFEALACSAR